MKRFLAFLAVSIVLTIGGVCYAVVFGDSEGVKFGTGATGFITNSLYGCDAASDAAAGTWSSRSTSTSTKAAFTLTGAAAGDTCVEVLGAAAAATQQALAWTCEVSSTNTVTEHVTNASGGSLTPTTGKRCALVLRAQ